MEEEAILRWLDSDRHVKLTTPDQLFCLAIHSQEEAKLIGYIGLHFRDSQCQQANLSIMLNPKYHGTGAALEALQAAMRFCLVELNMHRLCAYLNSRNEPALKLFERAGMRREGEFVRDRLLRGQWVNTVVMAALKEDLPMPG